jgi:hypothetical protein
MECTPKFLLFLDEIHVFEVNSDFSSATSSLTAIFSLFFTTMLSQGTRAKPLKFSKISELILFANVLSTADVMLCFFWLELPSGKKTPSVKIRKDNAVAISQGI